MRDYFDFLIDLALDTKDYEWLSVLQKSKLEYMNNIGEIKQRDKSVITVTLEIKNMSEIEQLIENLRHKLANLEIGFSQDED